MEIKKKKRQLQATSEERAEEAYAYLVKKRREGTLDKKQKDECDIFGELIAAKLKSLDHYTRQFVMNDINNLMFRATINKTRVLQESQHSNFVHSPQEFTDYSNSPQSIISHSPLPLSPIITSAPTQSTTNELQIMTI